MARGKRLARFHNSFVTIALESQHGGALIFKFLNSFDHVADRCDSITTGTLSYFRHGVFGVDCDKLFRKKGEAHIKLSVVIQLDSGGRGTR